MKINKKLKNKKNIFKKYIIFFSIIIVLCLFFFIYKDNNINESNDFLKKLEILKETKESYMIVLTNKKNIIAKKENKFIKNIINTIMKLKNIEIIFLDYYKNNDETNYFIKKYNIIKLPSIIFVNKKNKKEKIFIRPFIKKEIIEFIVNSFN